MKLTFTIAAILITFLTGCITSTPPKDLSQWDTIATRDSIKFRFETVEIDSGWGYAIYADGKKLIMQRQIPVIEGFHTFKTQEDAYNCAQRVIIKLISGEMPPSVTRQDLIDMNILQQ